MRILVLEDEFISRSIMLEILSPYGEVDAAETGSEALDLYRKALNSQSRYELVFLDIMVPEMSGQDVLKNIRLIEEEHGLTGNKSAKIVMTTALGDFTNVKTAFKQQCEAYLIKPIDKEKIITTLESLGLP